MSNFKEKTFSYPGLDVNAASNSPAFNIRDFDDVYIQADLGSGTFSAAVLQAQQSVDGVNFHDISGKTTTGPGVIEIPDAPGKYIRVRVSTNEGFAGTADLSVVIKRASIG